MLNTNEKDKYINFLLRNKISPQQDDSSERYVAKFKIKPPEVSSYKENNPPTRRRSLSNRDQAATYRRGSLPTKTKETKPPLSNKNPFVLANKATKRPAVFRGDTNSSSFITFDNQTNQPRPSNLIDLIEKVEIHQSPLFGTSRANRLDSEEKEEFQSNNSYNNMTRSRSVPNVVEKKLNFEQVSNLLQNDQPVPNQL